MGKFIRSPEDYLKEPYSRVLIPDVNSGTYAAEILEFPGCMSQGDTPNEAIANLEVAAKAWLEAAMDLKQSIPPPSQTVSYGGKVLVRLPKSLHRQVSMVAEREGVSLNQFFVSTIAEKVGAYGILDRLTKRLDQHIVNIATYVASNVVANFTTITTPSVVGYQTRTSNFISMW